MTVDILERFERLSVWRQGDRRAPNKPLLLLWAIGRCLQGAPRLAHFELVRQEVEPLLRRFGRYQKYDTHNPFWRLRNDNVWELEGAKDVRMTASGDPFSRDLIRYKTRGGLTEPDYSLLGAAPHLALQIAESLVSNHFPESLHQDVLEATGVVVQARDQVLHDRQRYSVGRRLARDSRFRRAVLDAYGNRCAVCALDLRFKEVSLLLEAAHIKWHVARGPDDTDNGMALCLLHHKMFDAGVFAVLPELKIVVAKEIVGEAAASTIHQFHGEALRVTPPSELDRPNREYLDWHLEEVFKQATDGFH